MTPSKHEYCLIGHVTRDINGLKGGDRDLPGGSVLYCAFYLSGVGRTIQMVTSLAEKDRTLFQEQLLPNADWRFVDSSDTTVFRNAYHWQGGNDSDEPRAIVDDRRQLVDCIASPISLADIEGLDARHFLIGTQLQGDVDWRISEHLRRRGKPFAVEIQGLVRPSEIGPVVSRAPAAELMRFCAADVLKASLSEGKILTGEATAAGILARFRALGAGIVLLTNGSRGGVVWDGQSCWEYAARTVDAVDPTGCGDVFLTAFCDRIWAGQDCRSAVDWAAIASAEKAAHAGVDVNWSAFHLRFAGNASPADGLR